MKRFLKLIALLLVVAMLFTGCSSAFRDWMQSLLGMKMVPFSEMEYSRPDMETFRSQLNSCVEGAKRDVRASVLMDKVYALYDTYYLFYTNYKLANIYYYKDLTNTYWADEYAFCLENVSEIDAGMDQLLYALAGSKLKKQLEADRYFGAGFFNSYTGQSLWDETFTELMAKEMKLQNEYDALSAQVVNYPYYTEGFYHGIGAQMERLLVELVAVRQKIAAQAGYENYPEFAYDFYYDRDYTPEQAVAYMEDIRQELAPLYIEIPSDAWLVADEDWTQERMFSYVESTANNMGGIIAGAFTAMKDGGYYDITYSPNKYNASFETYLQYYYAPFIFVNPRGDASDPLTFAHEFGHFCNDYAASGTVCGVDVAEVFSQGMAYMSLYYAQDGEKFKKKVLADSLSVFVEQSIYASFEHQLYLMEDLTVENVRALYAKTVESYGLEELQFDSRAYIGLTHLYIAPMYMLSYVLSNDLAMQIYQAEDAASGQGKKLLQDNLATEEVTLMSFVKSAGLQDPFQTGRVAQLRETFEKVFG